MRIQGTLKSWNDERGFGFIEPIGGGQEIFVHIKSFPAGTGRPTAGQSLNFEVRQGPDGKKRAHDVQYPVRARATRPVAKPRRDTPAPWSAARVLALVALPALCVYAAIFWGMRLWVPAAYAGLSLLTFFAYAFDKSAAIAGRWRTPENTLHTLGLIGGWPGALLAQQLLRHKSSKPSFIATFWITVALNLGAFVAWHTAGVGAA